MKPIRKILIAAGFVAAIGTGIFQARRATHWQDKMVLLTPQRDLSTEQLRQLRLERDETTNKVAAAQRDNDRLRQDVAALPELRGETTRLRNDAKELARLKGDPTAKGTANATADSDIADWRPAVINQIKQCVEQMPERKIPELQFLTDDDLLDLARIVRLDTEDNIRASLSSVRFRAKVHFGGMIKQALEEYIKAHGGEWPTELSQLKPYFPLPVDDFMLQRYQILAKGNLKDFLPDEALIAEKTPVDNDHDRLIRITPKAMFMQEVSAAAREHDALMKLARPRDH
jgi:hypothetical protein